MATLLATVLAAPLLLVEIAPGADAGTDAALTAFQTPAEAPARAVGSLSSEDLATTRLFSTLSVGEELRADAAGAVDQAAVEAERAAEADAAAAQAAAAERQDAADRAARAAVTTTTTAPPPPPPPAPAPPASGPTAAQWAALRNCESSGNYAVVSANGRYFGAYQFSTATWNSIASTSGRGDLVGIQPNYAAPADQDAMAYALYARSGPGQWPHCGRHLS